jgi:hypothetical protein
MRTCSRKLQQQTRDLAVPDASICSWPGVRRSTRPAPPLCKQGLGVRVPLAPLISPCQRYFRRSMAMSTWCTCSSNLQQLAFRSSFCKGQRVSGRESLHSALPATVDRFHRGVMTRERAHRHSGARAQRPARSQRDGRLRALSAEMWQVVVRIGRRSTNHSSARCTSSQITST